MTKPAIILALVAITLIPLGCGPASRTSQTLAVSTAFLTALELFSDAKDVYAESVREAVGPTVEELSDPSKSALTGVAASWEIRWIEAEKKALKLQERFNEVTSAAEPYFDKLNEISSSISDPRLLEAERQRNASAREKWDDAYKDAFQTMKKLERLRQKGHDIHSVLLGAAMRDQIGGYVRELKAISHDADQLVKELDRLVTHGQELLT